jgi:very-short-patch-repair endonuclease
VSRKISIPNLDQLIDQYNSGISLYEIAKTSGISRPTLIRRFRERGIEIRNMSDSQLARWQDASEDTINKTLGNAWRKRRGSTDPLEVRIARAKTKFIRQTNIHKSEQKIAAFLENMEFPVAQQFPIGPYNLDIALHESSIAIEVVHLRPENFNTTNGGGKRTKYLLDSGWFVLYIIAAHSLDPTNTFACGTRKKEIHLRTIANDLILWLQHASSNPPLRGHYWMIWGDGKPRASHRYQFDNCPIVPDFLRPGTIPTN